VIEIIEHTADIRLRVSGKSLQELFTEALRGTIGLLQPQKGARRVQRVVKVEAPDTTILLVDFLSEALSNAHANREAYDDAVFSSLTETSAIAQLTGNDALAFGEDVKAVTYHEAEVRRDPNGQWSTVLVYDL